MKRETKEGLRLAAAVIVVIVALAAATKYASLANFHDLVRDYQEIEDGRRPENSGSTHLIRNYYVNVWFCLLLAFLAFQNAAIQAQNPAVKHGRTYVVLNNAYYVLMAILCLEMAASWDVYGRADVATWSAVCIAASIVNVYSLTSRHIDHKKMTK